MKYTEYTVNMCLGFRATQIKTYSWDNAQVILVGNKCDLEDDRLIPTEDSQRLADELGKRTHAYVCTLVLMYQIPQKKYLHTVHF